MRSREWVGLGLLIALALGTARAGVEVPVSVREPAGVARRGEPASGGIPFKPAQVKDVADLILVDAAGKPLPAQFTKLAGYDDGSVQWALVDAVVPELAANGTVRYTIRTGSGAAPARPLKIEETDDKVVVDTGVVTFTVNKANFALFDEVTIGGRKVVTGGSVDLLNCELAERKVIGEYNRETTAVMPKEGGQAFLCRAGKPGRVKWEYRGPIRATLRIDGDYVGEGGAPLAYTTRITAWAGVRGRPG